VDNYYIENWSLWLDVKFLLLHAGSGVQARRMSTATVQRMSPTWVWMQVAVVVFVVIGIVIAAIKLWA
jgi:hypothetical protein